MSPPEPKAAGLNPAGRAKSFSNKDLQIDVKLAAENGWEPMGTSYIATLNRRIQLIPSEFISVHQDPSEATPPAVGNGRSRGQPRGRSKRAVRYLASGANARAIGCSRRCTARDSAVTVPIGSAREPANGRGRSFRSSPMRRQCRVTSLADHRAVISFLGRRRRRRAADAHGCSSMAW